MKLELRGSLLLLLATLIWGTSLVAQSLGMDHISPFAFNAARFFIGILVLLPFIIIPSVKRKGKPETGVPDQKEEKILLKGGCICGVVLFITATLQQIGISYTTVGKAGFITALYIVIVPFSSLFFGRRIPRYIWGCIAAAAVGMYLLCMDGRLALGLGDSLVLGCAFSTAVHILLLDYFSPRVNSIKLTCLQFFVCSLLSALCSVLFEQISLSSLTDAAVPILYTGVLSCGAAYTLQALGQKYVSPVAAALILSLESVFSVLSGWIILGELLSLRQAAGCVLMFFAIITAQLPDMISKKTP